MPTSTESGPINVYEQQRRRKIDGEIRAFDQWLFEPNASEWRQDIAAIYFTGEPVDAPTQRLYCEQYQKAVEIQTSLREQNRRPNLNELGILETGKNALHNFIEANMFAVGAAAKKKPGYGHTMEDLLQSGIVGIIKGMRRYDATKHDIPMYYIWDWINKEIKMTVDSEHEGAHIGYHLHLLYQRARRTIAQYKAGHGEEPEFETLFEIINNQKALRTGKPIKPVTRDRLQSALEIQGFSIMTEVDLTNPKDADEESGLESAIYAAEDVADITEDSQLREVVNEAMNRLAEHNIGHAVVLRLLSIADLPTINLALTMDIQSIDLEFEEGVTETSRLMWQVWTALDLAQEHQATMANIDKVTFDPGHEHDTLMLKNVVEIFNGFGITMTGENIRQYAQRGQAWLKKYIGSRTNLPESVIEYLNVGLPSGDSN